MLLNRLNIASKLWLSIIVMVAGLVLVSGIGLSRNSTIMAEGREAQATSMQMVQIATEWAGLTESTGARNQALVLSSEPGVVAIFKPVVEAAVGKISDVQKRLEAMPLTDADKAQLKKIAELRASVIEARKKTVATKNEGRVDEAMQLMSSQYLPAMASYLGALKELVHMQEQRVADALQETEERRHANAVGIVVGLVAVVCGIGIMTAKLVHSIRDPLIEADAVAARIAKGDLSADITTRREDEFGSLLRSLKTMNDSLGTMVHQVRESTDSIATGSAEIATGNNDLAHRTEQTSSDLQATASAMDELTHTVRQSADNARQASSLASDASDVAERGGTVVKQVVHTMEEINTSSRKISDIIGVIDGIAFQTNILALNAAVEAARAGEQGRGFAVVASEVRSLAQRSAEAAKEIKTLIGTSVEKVESGTQLVSAAGETMNDIVQSVRKVADVISEITATSSEQSAGIASVNEAIAKLDQMTQQNAALVEQSAAAAESLREQSSHLASAVAVFKTR
jgi:methyl-accepting chemotaxis protein